MSGLTKVLMLGAGVLALASAIGTAARADAISDFYKGKNVQLIIGAAVGGSYDVYGRAVGRHLWRHIPGKPRLITQNKNGAGSQITAGYVYNVAPQDGTVIAGLLNTLAIRQAVGLTRKTFDVGKFNWIGNITDDVTVLTLWNAATKARTVDDLRKTEVIAGVTTSTGLSATIPKAMNYALGTKFKLVTGYKGGAGVDQAMERGEVVVRAGANWSVVATHHADWIRDKKITIVVQIGSRHAKGLENVPLMHELARNEEERKILNFFTTPMDMGKPYAVGPKVPAARVKALRAAFDAMTKDPTFNAEAEKLGLVISPVGGAALQKLVADIAKSPKSVTDVAKKIFGKPKKRKKKKKKKAS